MDNKAPKYEQKDSDTFDCQTLQPRHSWGTPMFGTVYVHKVVSAGGQSHYAFTPSRLPVPYGIPPPVRTAPLSNYGHSITAREPVTSRCVHLSTLPNQSHCYISILFRMARLPIDPLNDASRCPSIQPSRTVQHCHVVTASTRLSVRQLPFPQPRSPASLTFCALIAFPTSESHPSTSDIKAIEMAGHHPPNGRIVAHVPRIYRFTATALGAGMWFWVSRPRIPRSGNGNREQRY